jgi:hypothetical protein
MPMERHGPEFWRKRIAEQQLRRQSVMDYCDRQGLSRYTFMRWQRRLAAIKGAELVEIKKLSGESTALGGDFLAEMELCLPDGLRARFRSVPEPTALAEFVAALRSSR